MVRLINKASDVCGQISAWLLLLTGVALTWEVVARYAFNAPTKWASETSELLLIWAVFLAIGFTVRHNRNIVIDLVYVKLPAGWQRALDAFANLFLLAFALVVMWYGFQIAWDSFEVGRTTATIMDFPSWWAESSVPFGFALAALQCAIEAVKALTGQGWSAGAGNEGH